MLVDEQEEGALTEDLGDEATNLFEELVDIDSQTDTPAGDELENIAGDSTVDSAMVEDDFSSEDFMDDMLSAAPEGDPLLDELDLETSSEREDSRRGC